MNPNIEIVGGCSGYILLRDRGPWDRYLTITNDAERVVAFIGKHYRNTFDKNRHKRIFYFDSGDPAELSELVHKDYKFIRFAPFPTMEEMLTDSEEAIRSLGVKLKAGGDICEIAKGEER